MVHIGNNTHLWAATWIKKLISGFVARCLLRVPELLVMAPTTNQARDRHNGTNLTTLRWHFPATTKKLGILVRQLSLLRANGGVLFDFQSVEKNSWAHAMLLELN